MATMDSHCKELELNAELVMHLNEAQAIKAIKEAEHPTTNSQGKHPKAEA